MKTFGERMIRAAQLDPALYEEVETDPDAMGQAMSIVVLSSLMMGVGNMGSFSLVGMLKGVIGSLASWFIWAYLTYVIGTRLLPGPHTRANYGELLKTIGFSSSPGILMVFGIIPGLSGIVYIVISVWMLAAMVVAVRQALDYRSNLRSLSVCIVGWFVKMVFYQALGILF